MEDLEKLMRLLRKELGDKIGEALGETLDEGLKNFKYGVKMFGRGGKSKQLTITIPDIGMWESASRMTKEIGITDQEFFSFIIGNIMYSSSKIASMMELGSHAWTEYVRRFPEKAKLDKERIDKESVTTSTDTPFDNL